MVITELLAPAKDKETAITAINCGADAVYIGANNFGARQNASNSIEDIKDVTNYAHKFFVKVFVTVNTIITDDELLKAVELVKELDKINVDGILIQDFGLLKKLMELNLTVPIHASTQCNNRTSEKVRFLNELGFSRVVLARELSLEQIRTIHNENPNIELEAFVHGALCVSYSGQCYLSQFIGGRSANRGECAQPCRKKYTVLNSNNDVIADDIYPLCLKDFNASKSIKEMIDAGIFSFKIEGRLKDKNYVKNITSYYRQELDRYSQKSSSGKSFILFKPQPDKSFNRGFTEYFLHKRENCWSFKSPKSRGELLGSVVDVKNNYLLVKTNKNISPQDGICFYNSNGLDGFLVNSFVRISKDMVKIFPSKKVNIAIKSELYRNSDKEFEEQLSQIVKRQISVNVLVKENIVLLTDEDGFSVSTQIPAGEPAINQLKMNDTFIKQFTKTGESDFYIENVELLSEIPFMPVSVINQLRRDLLIELMQKRIKGYKRNKQRKMQYAPYYEKNVDYRANIHNECAKEFYEACGVNVLEYSFEKKIANRQVELMRTKHCIKFALNMCKSPEKLMLKDEKGTIYPLQFDCSKCEMAVLSPKQHRVLD